MTLDKRTIDRLESIRPRPHDFPPSRKLLLLIRPHLSADAFTHMSHGWAENVKQKAIDEGWEVEDLSADTATRENIEASLTRIAIERPIMVMHYDHGSEFTLYGQAPGPRGTVNIERSPAVIDERNISMTAGMFVSAMACLSASGLGPLAIAERTGGFLGYSSYLWGSLTQPERFGEAVNAPNYALLEGKSPEEAFEIGYHAWNQIYLAELRAAPRRDGMFGYMDAVLAKFNRDYFTLLLP